MPTLQADETLLNPDVMLKAAKANLFDQSPINLIDDKYRDLFITGFTAHFLDDEIGLETLSRWKIALTEKLINHSPYINQIYEALDKQVFADYRITQTDSKKEHNLAVIGETTSKQDATSSGEENVTSKTDDKSVNRSENSTEVSGNVDRTNTSHTDDTEDTTRNLTHESTATDKHTGTDVTDHNATSKFTDTTDKDTTVTNDLTDTSTYHEGSTETRNSETTTTDKRDETKNGTSEETNKTITDANGDVYTSKRLSENGGPKLTIEMNDDYTDTSSNSHEKRVTKESNTPQNGLESIEDGTYLTAAQIVEADHTEDPLDAEGKSTKNSTHNYAPDPTRLPHDLEGVDPSEVPNGTWSVDGSKNEQRDYTPGKDVTTSDTTAVTGSGTETTGATNTLDKDTKDVLTKEGTVKTADDTTLIHDGTDTSKDTLTHDLTDTHTENGTDAETGKLTKDTTTTDTGNEKNTETRTENGTSSTSGNTTSERGATSSSTETVNGSTNSSTTTNGKENQDVETISYAYAHEILIRSESLTPRIWRLFEDLFMLIY